MKQKTKIGIVLKGYPRLSETFISQEILALEKQGFEFHIISLRRPSDKAVHPVNREIAAPVTYLPEYVHNEPLRVFRAWRKARKMDGCQKAWRDFRHDLVRDFTPNRMRRFAQGLVIAAEFNDSISCFYAHFLHTPASAARYAAKITGKRFAISAHAKDIWTTPKWEITEKLNDCEWLTTCTASGRDYLKGFGRYPDRICLNYHGLDLARFPLFPDKRVDYGRGKAVNAPLRMLTIGRAVPKKGLDNLLEALALLPDDLHWSWTHIGDGPLRYNLKKHAKKLGISEKCRFLGALAQKEVMAAYRKSDLFVLPCRIDQTGDRDGLPNVIIEAQSQGLAVISSPISGIPELIEDGVNGLLVEPDNAEKLTGAIVRLSMDADLRNKMGGTGRQRVENEFSHLSTIEELAKLLRNLLIVSQKEFPDGGETP